MVPVSEKIRQTPPEVSKQKHTALRSTLAIAQRSKPRDLSPRSSSRNCKHPCDSPLITGCETHDLQLDNS